jgi:hypothetical protein
MGVDIYQLAKWWLASAARAIATPPPIPHIYLKKYTHFPMLFPLGDRVPRHPDGTRLLPLRPDLVYQGRVTCRFV